MTVPSFTVCNVDRNGGATASNQEPEKCTESLPESVPPHVCVFDGSVIFLGPGKFSVGCGKGATFPWEKQSACNYIHADCV